MQIPTHANLLEFVKALWNGQRLSCREIAIRLNALFPRHCYVTGRYKGLPHAWSGETVRKIANATTRLEVIKYVSETAGRTVDLTLYEYVHILQTGRGRKLREIAKRLAAMGIENVRSPQHVHQLVSGVKRAKATTIPVTFVDRIVTE